MTTKIDYALCNSKMQPMMLFNNPDSLQSYMERQKEKNGKYPAGTPCKITTVIQTEKFEWAQSE